MGQIEQAAGKATTELIAQYGPAIGLLVALLIMAVVFVALALRFIVKRLFETQDKLERVKETASQEIADLNKQLNNEIRGSNEREREMAQRYDTSIELFRELYEAKRGR